MPDNTVATMSSLLPTNVMTAEVLRLYADRDSNLLAHPAMCDAGDAAALGHTTVKMGALGLEGYRTLSPIAEGADMAGIAVDDDEVTVTVAPYRKVYPFTDLARAVLQGKITPATLAMDAVKAANMTLVELLAALGGGFSNTSGTPGSALTAAQVLAAKNALGARSIPGPYLCLLSGIQFGHFQASLATSTAGAIQWMEATQAQIDAFGEGFKGTWGGVWIFVSNKIPTMNAGVDHGGCMFGRGAIVWAKASFAPEADPNILDFGGNGDGQVPVRFERSRFGTAGKTKYIAHAQLGITEGFDTAGQSLITKATA